jgi:hypothetical protein
MQLNCISISSLSGDPGLASISAGKSRTRSMSTDAPALRAALYEFCCGNWDAGQVLTDSAFWLGATKSTGTGTAR